GVLLVEGTGLSQDHGGAAGPGHVGDAALPGVADDDVGRGKPGREVLGGREAATAHGPLPAGGVLPGEVEVGLGERVASAAPDDEDAAGTTRVAVGPGPVRARRPADPRARRLD